jgi:hypothetical protein
MQSRRCQVKLGNPNDLYLGTFSAFLALVDLMLFHHTLSALDAILSVACGALAVLYLWRYLRDIL